MKLKLIEFIEENPTDWREILQLEPYALNIKDDGQYTLLTYSKTGGSDFSLPLVQECRGLIINNITFKPVCVPFTKFFNVQESNAHYIDWASARFLEKLDGSIIKVWYDDDGWMISTNGTIDARNANLQSHAISQYANQEVSTYLELFVLALEGFGFDEFLRQLDTGKTYMFELVSPLNKIVVSYDETKLYHIGTRDNKTLNEVEVKLEGVGYPKSYSISSLEDCLEIAKGLSVDNEGYVIVDQYYNRVKVKGSAYVDAHAMRGDGVLSLKRALRIFVEHKDDDFVSMFPEYTSLFEGLRSSIGGAVCKLKEEQNSMPDMSSFETRKDFAIWAKTKSKPHYFFGLADGNWEDVDGWLERLHIDDLLGLIGEK
jgi:hypothetical protein